MKVRHKARECAIQILYQCENSPLPSAPIERAEQLNQFFDHFSVPEQSREYCALVVSGTLASLAEIDPLIETHLKNWKMARLPSIDRSIMRLGVYELLHQPSVDKSVVINEAVELAKGYGSSETAGFVNAVLDAIASKRNT